MTSFVTRAQWGAKPPTGSGNSLTGKGRGVCLHWEGPAMGERPHSDCDNIVRAIQRFHMAVRGWDDIAYNLMACPHGYIFEGRGRGKGSGANGTSEANHNYPSVCALVGTGDAQPPALHTALADAAALLRSWGVGPEVRGHRDFVSTACPGDAIYRQLLKGRYSAALSVDGWLGSATISRWQTYMGTPVDGVISRPSALVVAVQRHLNMRGMRDNAGQTLVVDGFGIQSNQDGRYPTAPGTSSTLEALQRYLSTPRDGYLSAPSECVSALQRRLNAGTF